MNSESRKRLRRFLFEEGYERTGFTRSEGQDEYSETWKNGETIVTIQWGPNDDVPPLKPVLPPAPAPVYAEREEELVLADVI